MSLHMRMNDTKASVEEFLISRDQEITSTAGTLDNALHAVSSRLLNKDAFSVWSLPCWIGFVIFRRITPRVWKGLDEIIREFDFDYVGCLDYNQFLLFIGKHVPLKEHPFLVEIVSSAQPPLLDETMDSLVKTWPGEKTCITASCIIS